MLTDEKQLAKRVAARDPQTFAELYNLYVDKIYKYVYYRIYRMDEAEDLTAQVFLKAWEASGNYRWEGYHFSTWLYRIAHNKIIDYYRTHRETWTLDTARTRESGLDLLDVADRAFTSRQIRSALQRLNENQREVVILRFFEGYSIAEIAAIMDKRPVAIRALQHRALQALQPRLVEETSREWVYQPRALASA